MDDKMITNQVDAALLRRAQELGAAAPSQSRSATKPAGQPFGDILAKEIAHKDLKFSAHAQARIRSRSIQMTGERMDRLQGAVELAEQKGAKDALVLLDDLALVVSIKNRTVITAVDGEALKENVFTNIDSAVIT
jgi:flagellar operon protein